MALLEKTLARTLDLFFPRNCQFCAEPLAEEHRGVVCPACLAKAKFIEPPFCHGARCRLMANSRSRSRVAIVRT